MTTRATNVVVRRARAGDLDAVVAMRCALLDSSHENPAYRRLRSDYASVARPLFAAQLADARCLTLVAASGAKPVGLLRCLASAANPLYRPLRHAYLLSVYVLPAHRRRGVLKKLLAAADRWCRENGLDEMRLHVGVENNVAGAAWHALGFLPAEVLRIRRIPDAEVASATTLPPKKTRSRKKA